jgi:hypothetical protein
MKRFLTGTALVVALAGSADARSLCASSRSEELHYSWRLRGGLAWVASIRFPTSGKGTFVTVPQPDAPGTLESELKITAANPNEGFYVYQSQIAEENLTTLMTYHGYSYGEKRRNERTLFDYVKKLARIRKETPEEVENRVKQIPGTNLRDVLTGIHYLRQKSSEIVRPMPAEIYSDGRLYPVVFSPVGIRPLVFEGRNVRAKGYQITAAPSGAKKWPGRVQVWISDDAKRMPLRIEILRNLANLQLDLERVGSCESIARFQR